MINVLQCSNSSCGGREYEAASDNAAALTIIRFEEEEQHEGSPSHEDWSQLWPFFDCCCNDDDNTDFVSRLRQEDYHCTASISKSTRTYGSCTIECKKISYSLNLPEKHILLAHHFHKVDGEVKETIRMVTSGLPLSKIETVLCKALLLLKTRSSASDIEFPGGVESLARIPHPKVIVCAVLECVEQFCKTQVADYRKWIEKIEKDVNAQRDPSYSRTKGLESNYDPYVKLSEAGIKLGDVRQKLQYLLSSIASLQEMTGLPGGCNLILKDAQAPQLDASVTNETRSRLIRWWHQLEEARVRLIALKGNCQQHNINIENLRERVKGILSMVSILLIIAYQTSMLKQQEIIVARTKRDNTVMKVIAVLTALFLPGTFIATIFSMQVFNWDQENPIGPHFKTYWYFTAPITTVLVVGFSAWFLKMRYEDNLEEKRRMYKTKAEEVE
ncbi:uncharacterized protein PAC_18750 [Phialocephala subalpina]|uniref:Uncharacterized protein n=1 Tax=Phialocephala subalpina TaxID=576137 RepID=A0A1L7XV42_9HELO|nr:uncharacterized protein PAC_18750 [Phialocephala subalpina]